MIVVRLEDGTDPYGPEEFELDVDMSLDALFRHRGWLDGLAAKAGVLPLTDFIWVVAEDLVGIEDDEYLQADDWPPARWFDPAAGLAAVRVVAAAVAQAGGVPEQRQVLDELAVIGSAIEVAAQRKVRFRLTQLP